VKSYWEHITSLRNMLRTWWDHINNNKNPHPHSPQKITFAPLVHATSPHWLEDFFWLLVFFVTFWPMVMAAGWSMGMRLYVWNPWQTSGQVCYPYIKICQKISSFVWCKTSEKQFTTSTKQDSYIKCSTKLNAVARSCSIRTLINFYLLCLNYD
jgi:hypothetical protein